MDDLVWAPTVFTKNGDRLLEGNFAGEFFEKVLDQARERKFLSDEHFTVDGTLVEAWTGHKSFKMKDAKKSKPKVDGASFRSRQWQQRPSCWPQGMRPNYRMRQPVRPVTSGAAAVGPACGPVCGVHRWVSMIYRCTAIALAMSAAVPFAVAAQTPDLTWNRPLPLGAKWALRRGIDLPNPFGVGLFVVTMSRDIEVTDVRVSLPGGEPASVSDVGSFAVRNHTTLAALKFDAWLLPVLNVYGLAGYAATDSRLNAAITIDRILAPPEIIQVTQDADVGGPLVGVGATAVAGYGPWFILTDANYNYSEIRELDDGLAAWFVSARTGWSGATRLGAWRAWVGAAWLATDRTLRISQESPALGTVLVEVDQQPLSPLTWQVGGGVSIGRRLEMLVEVGSNFDDAFLGVLSASFRF